MLKSVFSLLSNLFINFDISFPAYMSKVVLVYQHGNMLVLNISHCMQLIITMTNTAIKVISRLIIRTLSRSMVNLKRLVVTD